MSAIRPNRSQAWFPGTYVPVRHIHGLEFMPEEPRRRAGVQVAKTMIHGTAAELRSLAFQILAAAERIEPTPRAQPALARTRRMQAA
jgi:hypothetical protein